MTLEDRAEAPQPDIVPALSYEKGQAALDFLATAFGFDELMAARDASGRVIHAELKFGNGVLYLGEIGSVEGHEAVDATRFAVSAYVEDVDGHYERARAAGAEIVQPPADTDFGARLYSVRDSEGNLWSFGNYRPAT